MNMMPLAALLLSCLAVAISVCTAIAVMRRPVRHLTSPVPRRRGPLMQDAARRRQVQVGGDGSTQVQSGGTITIHGDSVTPGMTEEQITEMVKRAGRHL